jgi:hypothetical protein
MFDLTAWQVALLGLALAVAGLLLAIWWRQQTYRWIIVVVICLALAPLLSWWSGMVFQVADYRAGCDGLCPGYGGAPIPFSRGETAGGEFLRGRFLVNSLAYVVILLGWCLVLRVVLVSLAETRGHAVRQVIGFLALLVIPLAVTPWVLPPPEAHVRGDSQRIAINAQREVYLYDGQAEAPVLRAGLADVRPRGDGQPGMRVCLRIYTLFYLPIGYMFLDMTPEGVHSNAGGVLSLEQTCWQ